VEKGEGETMKLYKMDFDCGRMGSLFGVFLAEPQAVAAAMGKQIYFGEVLGKHSEICGPLGADEVKALDVPDEFVKEFAKHFPDGFGYNPLKYIHGEES
jgi:hypothetical protein